MQRYFVNSKNEDSFKLDLESTHHIINVMRMNLGDLVEIVYENAVFICEIISLEEEAIVKIKEKVEKDNELAVRVTICQSLVKEAKMDLILQKSVELGAYAFVPLKVKNSIIKGTEIDLLKKVNRWQKIVKDASRQSKRNLVPVVNSVMDIKKIAELDYDLKILCTVNEMTISLKNILQNNRNCGTMIIVVGPEGGFTTEEENYLISKGFISTSLGNLVLRTETAAICALSMINYEYER